jgi:hypothetical protein
MSDDLPELEDDDPVAYAPIPVIRRRRFKWDDDEGLNLRDNETLTAVREAVKETTRKRYQK